MKRILFITGHYGSGKTEIALNLAIAEHYQFIIDLDGINPYFRSREHTTLLSDHGIQLIASDVPNGTFIDTPFISKRAFLPFNDSNSRAIYDLGGSSTGARFMRQFTDYDFNEVDFLLVVNIYRQETSSVEKILQVIDEIQSSSGRKLTGLIHNSNLLRDTTRDEYLQGLLLTRTISQLTKLPIVMTAGLAHLQSIEDPEYSLPLTLYLRKKWL